MITNGIFNKVIVFIWIFNGYFHELSMNLVLSFYKNLRIVSSFIFIKEYFLCVLLFSLVYKIYIPNEGLTK